MPTIEFFVDIGGKDGHPHTFIKIDNDAGDVDEYGFVPVDGKLWGPGHIDINTDHEYQFSSGPIEVSIPQYNAMLEYIIESKLNPPYYNLPANIVDPNGMYQCSQWAGAVAGVGGVDWKDIDWNPYNQALNHGLNKLGNNLIESIKDLISKIRSIFGAGAKQGSPIILDLDKDGVETTALTSGTYFDHDANGFSEQTGWASSDDGLLVMDRDADGLIEDGTELFGDNTLLANGTKASNGFQALAELDTNTDGKIDASDTAYNQLKIWQDIDEDGFTSEGELHSFRLLSSV